jgi:uncharacterized protein HemY
MDVSVSCHFLFCFFSECNLRILATRNRYLLETEKTSVLIRVTNTIRNSRVRVTMLLHFSLVRWLVCLLMQLQALIRVTAIPTSQNGYEPLSGKSRFLR